MSQNLLHHPKLTNDFTSVVEYLAMLLIVFGVNHEEEQESHVMQELVRR